MTLLTTLDLCREYDVVVEEPGKGVQPFDPSLDQFMASVKAFVAAQEREKISERTKAGMAAARASGVRLGAPKGHKRNRGWRKQHDPSLFPYRQFQHRLIDTQ